MTHPHTEVFGGVDTYNTHVAAAINAAGQLLGTASFTANAGGYSKLLAWLRTHGRIALVGVEGTGTYGAGLARYLSAQDIKAVEVNRPNRQTRRLRGKNDTIDAEAAARAAPRRASHSNTQINRRLRRSNPVAVSDPPIRYQSPHPGRQPTQHPRSSPHQKISGNDWRASAHEPP